MIPCVLFEAGEESKEHLPAITVTGTDDGFATPRDIVALAEPTQGSQDACFNSGMLGESSGHFHQKRHKRTCAEGGQFAN